MQLDERARQWKPEADALIRAGVRILDDLERLHDAIQVGFGNADAGVAHGDGDRAVRRGDGRHGHAAAVGRVGDGVAQQIEQHLLDHAPVGAEPR
jgi:hypothetical protein